MVLYRIDFEQNQIHEAGVHQVKIFGTFLESHLGEIGQFL